MQHSGGAALVAALEAHGVDTAFGIPGTHNLAVFSALAQSRISTVLTRHEQGAGYAADGYARVSGRPGVCVTTAGPAILNALAAAAQAWSDSIPVLFVSPGLPTDHPGRGNGYLHEVKDQRGAVDAVVTYSHRVSTVAEIPLAVAYAFSAMTTGRPRPVHLEIPLDLLDARAEAPVVTAPPAAAPVATAGSLARAAEQLTAARKPAVLAGGGAQAAAGQLARIAERLEAPVVTTANGKGVLDEDHRLCVGAGVHHPSVRELLTGSDAVLAIGTELAPSDFWAGQPTSPETLIRIDIDPASIVTNATPGTCLLGDAAATLDGLCDALDPGEQGPGEQGPGEQGGLARAETARARFRVDAEAEGARWSAIIDALAPAVDERTVVAGDSAMACYYGALSNLAVHRPRGFLYPTGMGTLGYGLPAAIGAATADPSARVLAMLGDGGAMFTLPELATAAQQRIGLPVLIVDNGGYGEIRDEMRDRGEPLNAVALDAVEFPTVARAFGCYGRTIEAPGELTAAVRDAFAADRPTLLHIHE